MLTDAFPFSGINKFEIEKNIINMLPLVSKIRPISVDAMQLVKRLLTKNYEKRITIDEVLESKWLKSKETFY